MRKILPIFVALFCITGCTSQKVNNPYEINIDIEEKILSYYDNKDNINSKYLSISNDTRDAVNSSNKPNTIIVNNDGIIRFISITDKNVTTYKQIKIGDDIKKVIDVYNYEYQPTDTVYSVIFNDSKEEDPTNQNKKDNWIWINYRTDGSKITQIQIYDVKYGREMR